jgi:hypothetical protein
MGQDLRRRQGRDLRGRRQADDGRRRGDGSDTHDRADLEVRQGHQVLELDGATPAEVWLDTEQRPVRISLGKTTVTYDSWASDVVIIAPPPEAVGEPVSR